MLLLLWRLAHCRRYGDRAKWPVLRVVVYVVLIASVIVEKWPRA